MKQIDRIKGFNVFGMFERNKYCYGFWFDSWRWANTCCRLLYFEYKGRRLPEHRPIWVWQKEWKHITAVCEFWDIRRRCVAKTGPLPVPWSDELYEMWLINKQNN